LTNNFVIYRMSNMVEYNSPEQGAHLPSNKGPEKSRLTGPSRADIAGEVGLAQPYVDPGAVEKIRDELLQKGETAEAADVEALRRAMVKEGNNTRGGHIQRLRRLGLKFLK
jgi:hypothetical protein